MRNSNMSRRAFLPITLVAALLTLAGLTSLTACGPEDESSDVEETEKEPFSCTLGVVSPDGEFTALGPTTKAELQFGFQGFLFTELYMRTDSVPEGPCDALMAVTVDGDDPFNAKQGNVTLAPVGVAEQGEQLTEPILVFFSGSDPSAMEGRIAAIQARLETDIAVCTVEASALLVDEDACIHTGAEPICPEDGVTQ